MSIHDVPHKRHSFPRLGFDETFFLMGEHHVDPIIRTQVRVRRKPAGGTIHVQPVTCSGPSIHQRRQWRITHSRGHKITAVYWKISCWVKVRGYIHGVRRDRYPAGKIRLLPARSGLSRKSHCCEQRSRVAPKMSNVCPGVVHALVETYPGNESVATRCEPDSQFE